MLFRSDLARLGRVATVDAWLGGHSHNVVDDRVEGRPILIAGAQGQWLAVVDLVVDPVRRRVVESTQRIDQVWADGPVDSAWTARVARWNEAIGPISATVLGREAQLYRVRFEACDDVYALLEQHGRVPLPLYITREAGGDDASRYQTIYARAPGAVAA